MTVRRLLALLAATVLGSGCASFLRPDGPRTQRPGTKQFLMAPSAYLGEREDSNFFNLDLLFRYGLAERVDLGMRLNFLAVAADVKVQLLRAPDPGSGVDLALAPSVGYGTDITWSRFGRGEASLQLGLPVMVGVNLGTYQLLLTPQLLYQRDSVLPDGLLHLGGTVGFGRIGDGGFRIYPALAIWKTLDARHPLASLRGPGPLMFQPALIFRWGQ